MLLKVIKSTFAKQSTVAAVNLEAKHKLEFSPGDYEVLEVKSASLGHVSVKFPAKKKGFQSWFFFADHVEYEGQKPKSIRLPVPYFSQRDNIKEYWRTCNTSSHAMAIKYLKPDAIFGDDDYFTKHVDPYGDSTDWGVHTRALERLGIPSEYRTDLGLQDILDALQDGFPVPIGVLHHGSLENPSGGHVILVVGVDGKDFICHDPWGEGFGYQNHNGKFVRYPESVIKARWLPDGGRSGWGRIFQE